MNEETELCATCGLYFSWSEMHREALGDCYACGEDRREAELEDAWEAEREQREEGYR